MKGGHVRTPTNLLLLRRKRGDRDHERADEPKPTGEIGAPPKHLSAKEKACWEEIVRLCHKGVLFEVDRLIVEQGACLLASLRAVHFHPSNPSFLVRFEHVLASLGMTPADRSRVKAPDAGKSQNPFAEFEQSA